MKYLIFVAIGGAFGSSSRYLLSNWIHGLWEGRWPLGTLMVNVLGSLAIGVLYVLLERQVLHPDWRGVLMVGFLGAFTTFSTFSLEAVTLLEAGEWAHALVYVATSAALCVAAAGAGLWLMRSLG